MSAILGSHHILTRTVLVLLCHMFYTQANTIGRSAKTVREFLEKNYKEEDMESDEMVLKLAVRALLEVLELH